MAHSITTKEVKARFEERGETISDWADRHSFPRSTVYAVLNGRVRGRRGIGHQVAVALGLKAPPPSDC